MKLRKDAQQVGFLVMDKISETGCPPSLLRDAVKSAAEELEVELSEEETDWLVEQLVQATK